ncbi:MAG TPA: magnesium/cobalt transporter CorA [Anaerolineaceae bacterium]|nr:magnesium/cobalt transporter CorA [Anaerolineaceae bacterium]
MLRSVQLIPGKAPLFLESVDEISHALSAKDGFIWVSLEEVSEEETKSILDGIFNFHPLAIEDCLNPGYQVSKIDDFSDYLFLITHAIKTDEHLENLDPIELDLFLGENYLVTCSSDARVAAVEKTWERILRDNRLSKYGADFLCHTILDAVVDEFMPLIDSMETEVEWIEDSAMEKPTPETLQRLLSLKHSIMSLRRIIAPQREVMNRLSRDEYSQIESQNLIYFRDIYDHLVRIQDLADIIRDIVSGALDIYLNSTSLRLNEIMKALTIVSTVFLPLSFITGAFGMNFIKIPGAAHEHGFLITCAFLLILGVAMLLYFRKRRWF